MQTASPRLTSLAHLDSVSRPHDRESRGESIDEFNDGGAITESSVWIVIAAYNEAERIDRTLASLAEQGFHQVIVVDDGSRDHTSEVASRKAAYVLRHPVNCGQGAALQTGIDFALQQSADVIVTFDADNQHDASEIGRLVLPICSGELDVVLGSRFLGKTVAMPFLRRVLLNLAIWYTRLTTRLGVTDTHNGFRAFSRKAAQAIRIRHPRMAHASEILEEIARHKLAWQEQPVTIRYTQDTLAKGQTSWDAAFIAGQLVLGRLLR